jgi:phosphoribosylanthranilate isomerase
VELADRPIILAGGLTPENVKRAILEVRPAGVDSHTGVEDSTGRKSREKVQLFLSERPHFQGNDHPRSRSSSHDAKCVTARPDP